MKFLITDLGEDEIILGYPWLAAFQPKINWKQATLDKSMQPLVIKTLGLKIDDEVTRICTAWCKKAAALATPGEEVFIHRFDEAKIGKTSMAVELAIKALPKEEKTWDQIVPVQYHKWEKVFSEEEAKQFPQHQPWDIAIDLVEGAPKTLDCKIYPLTLAEQGKLENYIKENLEKGYIHPSSLSTPPRSSLLGKRMGNLGQSLITENLIPSPSPIDTPFPSSRNWWIKYETPDSFQKWTYKQDTTISEFKKVMNTRRQSKPIWDYLKIL
jgi:hypothetical protein